MKLPIHLSLVLLCTLSRVGVAQDISGSQLALSLGQGSSDFVYSDPNGGFSYDFENALPSLVLSNRYLSFMLSYAQQENNEAMDRLEMEFLEGAILGGPNLPVLKLGADKETQFYIPIRVGLEYRFVSIVDGVSNIEAPNLYMLEGEAGLGLGVVFFPSAWDSRASLRLTGLSLAGIQKELGDQFSENRRWMRNLHLDAELRLSNMIGGFGIVIGYTRRNRRWSDEGFDLYTDKVSSILNPRKLSKKRNQNILRFGLVWQVANGIK